MNTVEFIDLIQQCDYIPEKQINSLRNQLEKKRSDVTSKEILELLLEKKHITKYQAKRLLELEKQGGKPKPEDDIVEITEDDLVEATMEDDIVDLTSFDDPLSSVTSGSPFDEEVSSLEETSDSAKDNSKFQKKEVRDNPWDSPLMLFGSGGLILLLLLGGLLYFWLTWDSGDDQFQLAEQDYQASSYTQAIAKYQKFIGNFPSHPQVDLAKVRLGMANLRNEAEGSSDWERTLKTANKVLPEIEILESFNEARPELASLLPDILEGFANQAKVAKSVEEKQRHVDNAKSAMLLINNGSYLPTSQRQTQQTRIDTLLAEIERVERSISRDTELNTAIEKIKASANDDGFEEIYQTRKQLIQVYPVLKEDASLIAAVSAAAEELKAQVKTSSPKIEANKEDFPSSSKKITLAAHAVVNQAGISNIEDTAVVQVDGSIYGIDTINGKLKWRRFVGFGEDVHPVRIINQQGQAEVVVFDAKHQSLLRLEAATGSILWRVSLGQSIFQPLLIDDFLFLAARSGTIWRIEATTGMIDFKTELPQQLSAGPGITSGLPTVFVPAIHSNVYSISLDDLTCKQIIPTGHEKGTIVVAPIATLRHLAIFENSGPNRGQIHVWKLNDQGLMEQAQSPVAIAGHVLVQPKVSESRILMANDHGAINVYKVDTGSKDSPLSFAVNPIKADRDQGLRSYLHFSRGALWVADQRLTKYEMQIANGTMIRKLVDFPDDLFAGPVQEINDLLIHTRKEEGKPGAVVSAFKPQGDKVETLWECYLSVPLAGSVINNQDQNQLIGLTARGDLHAISQSEEQQEIQLIEKDPKKQIFIQGNYPEQVPLADGRYLMLSMNLGDEAVIYDPSKETNPLNRISLEVPAEVRVSLPVALNKGVVFPSKTGHLFCIDPDTGDENAFPFQPPLGVDTEIKWGQPASLGEENNSFIITDQIDKIYLIQLEDGQEPALKLENQAIINMPLSPKLAVSGLTMSAIHYGELKDEIMLFQLPEFDVQSTIPLEGRVYQGPFTCGNSFVLASDKEGLVVVGENQAVTWSLDIQGESLLEKPLVAGDHWILTTKSGKVIKVKADSGELIETIDLNEPLAPGRLLMGNQIYLNGYDGTIHVLELK